MLWCFMQMDVDQSCCVFLGNLQVRGEGSCMSLFTTSKKPAILSDSLQGVALVQRIPMLSFAGATLVNVRKSEPFAKENNAFG